MKRKIIQIIGAFIVCIVTIAILSNVVFGVAMTKESLETNLKPYTDGSKTATATVDGISLTVGGSESTGTLTVDDTTITISASGMEASANYTVSDTETIFSVTQSYTADMSDENYTVELLKPTSLFPVLFLAVTDAQSVDSNAALTYYLEALTAGTTVETVSDSSDKLANAKATKISIDNDIFSYAQTEGTNTETEYSVTSTLTVKMNADFTTISNEESSGGNLISVGENETNSAGNAIQISNEVENDINAIGNEIFDTNNTADDDIPDAGPEDWIQVAIVLVSLVIIIIMLLNIMNTNKMKKL